MGPRLPIWHHGPPARDDSPPTASSQRKFAANVAGIALDDGEAMLGPYRIPAEVEADPSPTPCIAGGYAGPGRCPGCSPMRAHPARFHARIDIAPAALFERSSPFAGAFGKAFAAAATTLLFSASFAVAAVTWTVISQQAGRRQVAAARAVAEAAERAARLHGHAHKHDLRTSVAPALPQSSVTAAPARPPTAAPLTSLLAELGPPTHAPAELWKRAERLRAAGVDLTLTRVRMPALPDGAPPDLVASARIVPELRDGVPVGVRFFGVRPRSALGFTGLENGDLVTAVNGFGMADPNAALLGWTAAREARAVVVELVRGGRKVVLDIEWPAG